MTTFAITIDLDNAAFDPEPVHEVARILRELAETYHAYGGLEREIILRDINGNRVGRAVVRR